MTTLGKTWFKAGGWTAEGVAEVRRLREDGVGVTAIAQRFEVTRNAIMGLMHRRGITLPSGLKAKRATVARSKKGQTKVNGYGLSVPKAPTLAKAIAVAAEPPAASPAPTLAEPVKRGAWEPLHGRAPIPLARLTHFTCRWPIGAPVLFCCAPAPGIGPYCKAHTKMAIRKDAPWRVRPKTKAALVVNIRVLEGEAV